MSATDLHVFVFPFVLPGHYIPMLDLAKLLAARGVTTTLIATTATLARIQPAVDRSPDPVKLLTLPFPSSALDNFAGTVTAELMAETRLLDAPLKHLLAQHHPDCLVTDTLFPWTAALAAEFGATVFGFSVTGCFPIRLITATAGLGAEHDGDPTTPFVVPGIPHRIVVTKSELRSMDVLPVDELDRIREFFGRMHGLVVNTFADYEPGYADDATFRRWLVGPLSLAANQEPAVVADGGGGYLDWLDGKQPGSVVYVCFGSMGRMSSAQLRQLAAGLEASGHCFLWVLKTEHDDSVWMPEGFEKRVVGGGKGRIIKGWAPQVALLNHRAVGGFLTHCGWNSGLEAASAGVPMVAWPFFGDHVFIEKLLVDVLGVAMPVGVRVCSGNEEERTVVSGEEVARAVKELMGKGEEAERRREKVKEMAAMARRAVEEGGSSYNDLSRLMEEVLQIKTGRALN